MNCSELIQLGVNVDHIATVRQARGSLYPEVIHAALMAEQSGADGITAHLREDRRHIQDRDIHYLKAMLQTRLNLEMAVTDEMVGIALEVKPEACCLVPEKRAELTTEGGLDVIGQFEKIEAATRALVKAEIVVSLFIDAVPEQIEAAARTGAPVIELHTGHYAEARGPNAQQRALQKIIQGAALAHRLGLQVNAGHGLHYHNVSEIARIPEIRELNIGHAIIARALFSGLPSAVSEMKALMVNARNQSIDR